MEKKDLSAATWFSARAVVALLVGAGLFFLLRPDWLGYGALARWLGGEGNLHAVGLGIAFFVLAAQSWDKSEMRVQAAELMEALHQLLYGKDYARDREAIEILLGSLESADAETAKTAYTHLRRLTGQNFAQDPKVWRSWWEANRKRFERPR